MKSVCLIQGASRGIGLQYCRALLTRDKTYVIATCRMPNESEGLKQLQAEHRDNLHVLPVDVTNEGNIAVAATQVDKMFGKLDLLINCAGILHPSQRGETSLKAVTAEGLNQTFFTNTIGPLMMAKHFAPILSKGDGLIGKGANENQKRHVAVLVNMSAKVGSITDNGLGGWYSYRMSKAALNMATRNLSIELGRGQKKVVCISLHPGTVDTELSRPYHKNVPKLFTVEESVEYMLGVIDSLTLNDSGNFYTYDRTKMPF